MSRIIPIATYLVLSLLTGTALYVVWKLIGRWIEKRGYVDVNYWIWKIVLLAFLCPVPFLVILKIRKNGLYGFDFLQTKIINTIIAILCGIWIIGTILHTIRYIRKHAKIHKMIRKTGYEDLELADKVEEYCNKLQLHRNVQVVHLEFMEIPMVYGLLNPKILMPKKAYGEEELEIILLHELVHHKHHDLFWKQLFQIIRCIYWFHPAMKDILKQLDQWGETACDMTVSKNIRSVKEYFCVIIEMAVDKPEYDVYMAGLCEGTENIKLRMQRMKAYMSKKPLRRIVSVGVMLGIAGVSTVTVMASSMGVARGYSYILYETVEEENKEDDIDYTRPRLEKIRNSPSEKINEIVVMKEKVPKIDDANTIDVKIKPKQRIVMEGRFINEKKEKEIEISITTDSEKQGCEKIAIGIINEKNQERYIQGDMDKYNDILWHGFEIKENGIYRIYIENYGEQERHIMGYCGVNSYITLEEIKKDEENN